jgi:UDP-glucose 4-epimerase
MGAELELEFREPRTGDVKASQSDGLRVVEHFPEIEQVSLGDGLRRTFDWFRARTAAGR